ncbi:PREDICTED: terpene synthase 10-like [Ipomoea nil]|uniref:terpene synthase 10-like n=1 Tax=Ipomoea nil TaxID=35883 RepID=UPI00090143D0|nr:PREDICTED: terpene synthase 10-like [Ipomoea nil]
MASIANVLSSFTHKLPSPPRSHISSFRMSYQTTTKTTTIPRKSGNYGPPTWDFNYIQSLNTNSYTGERFVTRRDKLKEKVQDMLNDGEIKEAEKIEMIDQLQKFDCSYHFQDEINAVLTDIYAQKSGNNFKSSEEKDLYSTALEFRILRQNGFDISPEVFEGFMDGKRLGFNPKLGEDTKGLLNLYEASFLSKEDDTILEVARDFSGKHLKQVINHDQNLNDPKLLPHVQRALALPLHWRVPRMEARFYIDSFDLGKTTSNNSTLLDLAKVDFNIAQAVYLEDLRSVSRWWENSYITERLTFVRDSMVENFFWAIATNSNPNKFSNWRRTNAKLICLICTIDDIYDVYGTLDELHLFTDAIERWNDVTEIEHLPKYMRFCYLALYNFINEVAYDVLKEHDIFILHYLRKSWADLCKAYLQEAKWYHGGYTPTFEEYIENSWISISCPLILVHAFFFVNHPLDEAAARHCLMTEYHEIIRLSSMIVRLTDDKGTSPYEMERGDVPKAIQCYMNEARVSMDDACDFVDFHINETWKKLNKARVKDNCPFSETFIEVAMNLARVSHCMYQHGDGHGTKNLETQTLIQATLFEPIVFL